MREIKALATWPRKKVIALAIVALWVLGGCSEQTPPTETADEQRIKEKVIYGVDNRLDIYQVTNTAVVNLADSTAAVFDKGEVVSNSSGGYTLKTKSYKKEYGLCDDEPFADQPIGAFCSAFLVAEDLVVTAGHCIKRSYECRSARFVFGYEMSGPGQAVTQVSRDDVYSCKSIIKSVETRNGADFAVIKLDRKVVGKRPLDIRRSGTAKVGDSLFIVGYPVGLPKKVAGGANIRSIANAHFVANLDSYGGNSGSAVFNGITGEVEGILVRGETDFVSRGRCNASYKCSDNGCRGEDVTKISHVIPYIPEAIQPEEPDVVEDRTFSSTSSVVIPDNQSVGIASQIVTDESPNGRAVTITVDIEHTWTGDLSLILIGPDGNRTTLHNRQGGSADNIKGTYGVNLTSYNSLSGLAHSSSSGVWTLKVSDNAYWDRGVLRSWKLHFNK